MEVQDFYVKRLIGSQSKELNAAEFSFDQNSTFFGMMKPS